MARTPRTVVVVGGGITGLVAARDLARFGEGLRVALFEASDRLGGKIKTDIVDGAIVEGGADWFVTRVPDAVDLCRELGLGGELVTPAVTGASVWSKGKLHALPGPVVRGVPASVGGLLSGTVLSPAGKARALADLVLPGKLHGPDASVASVVRRRLGSEVLERLVDPMLAASRAGTADELGLAAAAPDLDAIARRHRSLILGARAQLRSEEPSAPPFLGLAGGMQSLVDRLVSDLGRVEVRLSSPVTRVEGRASSFVVSTAAGEVPVSGVVIATPSFAAASILDALSAAAAAELAAIEYASGAVVALVYESGATVMPGSGVLIPTQEGKLMTACALFSRKWEHARHPGDALVVRAFAGRTAGDDPLDAADDVLVERIDREIRKVAGVTGTLGTAAVTRWDKALPQYAVGHLDRLERVRSALSPWPALALGGAGYWGSGIPDCIRQGRAAATQVLTALGISRGP